MQHDEQLRDNGRIWDTFTIEYAQHFLTGRQFGIDHPSRVAVKDWIKNKSKKLERKLTLLDIPCGSGVDVTSLQDIVTYIGMDKTPVFVEAIQRNYPFILALQGDIRNIPCKDGEYDVVYARAIFEHLCDLEDVERAMKECFRVAKKFCIFSFFIPLQDETRIEWNGSYFNNTYGKKDIESILNGFSKKKLEHIFVESGEGFTDSYDIYFITK